MNGFVQYLNSLNNANSSNENALAEAQVTNQYYKKFHINRNLGNYLAEALLTKPTCVILTGHAGDGKTSLVYQILKELSLFEDSEGLKKFDTKYSTDMQRNLFYIKDMSELSEADQISLLRRALLGKQEGMSSIVVSNTGPLITTFKHLIQKELITGVSKDHAEMELLRIMDENKGTEERIGSCEVLLVNMARIDNVVMVPKLIEKVTSSELWQVCDSCTKAQFCPIYNNYLMVRDNKESVSKFITSYYRWLFESDRRLTIRQILAQLSYAMTGNLTCESVHPDGGIEQQFNYSFSNLFFGYMGLHSQEEALQIRAIQELQKLELDNKETTRDYDYFVRNDFTNLIPISETITSQIWAKRLQKYKLKPGSHMQGEEPYLLRKSVRRMNMLFGQHSKEQIDHLLDELFSPVFSRYLNYRERKWSVREGRSLKSVIYRALHYILVGTHPEQDQNTIYLPLQRKGTGMQNVQLLLGELSISDMTIRQEYKESAFDTEENHHEVRISFKGSKEHTVPLMLLDYFDRISKGAVSTSINPSLSHGIDRMKAQLFNDYKYPHDAEDIKLLIHTLRGPRLVKLQIDESEIFVD